MIEPRPEVLSVPPATHGGPAGTADERLPVRLDFSVSLNAYGPAPKVREAILAAPPDAYPDPECLAPRRAAAARWERPVAEIAFGAGAAELIHAACFAFVRPGDQVAVAGPTFGEYARAVRLCGGLVLEPAGIASEVAPRVDLDLLREAVHTYRPRLAFACAPNNPTGQLWPSAALAALADECERGGTLLVLDQSYDAFADSSLGTPALPGHAATLHLRSITKDHALAGVRAAFAIGPPAVIAALERVRIPWSASAAAQAAAVAALSEEGVSYAGGCAAKLRAAARDLSGGLRGSGLDPLPSDTHFFLVAVGDAAVLRGRLLREYAIKVRDCASFGLPRHIRIAARRPDENQQLLHALSACCV